MPKFPKITLEFAEPDFTGVSKPKKAAKKEKKKFRSSLSAAAFVADGQVLFVGGDETIEKEPTIELLVRKEAGIYGDHRPFKLSSFIDLPSLEEDEDGWLGEIDFEGFSVHGGYLWFTGSHCCNRKEPKEDDDSAKALERLATVDSGINRYLLGRIPIAEDPETGITLVKRTGVREAGRLHVEGANGDLVDELQSDIHLGPFLTPFLNTKGDPVRLPSKDNGFDIEGIAVEGDRVFLGLRGPVLRGWACILEIRIENDDEGGDFHLTDFGPDAGRLYRKHFVYLDGLGIRDIDIERESDGANHLLILAGSTMASDGPARVYRWKNAITEMATGDTVTPKDALQRLEPELPSGEGEDRPEGLTIIPQAFAIGDPPTIRALTVYDSPAEERLVGTHAVLADVVTLR